MTLYADIFLQFFRLGALSFGGPAAHLVNFERRFVTDKAWLSTAQYRQLVALCQFLPGPASSQVGIGIGLQRGGYPGALLAFLGFTLPSFVFMTLAGVYGLQWLGPAALQGALCALAAIVAHAIWQMSQSFLTDWRRRTFAVVGFGVFLLALTMFWQMLLLALFALCGTRLLRQDATEVIQPWRGTSALSLPLLIVLLLLLLVLPVSSALWSDVPSLQFIQQYFQAGTFVFGGGHVVLPLLEQSVGTNMPQTDFLAGYAAAQLMPGPIFSFVAYLGAMTQGIAGAILATFAVFLPGALLVCAIWPWWHRLGQYPGVFGAVSAVNCAVVGLLASTWWQFILPHAAMTSWHWLLMLSGFLLLLRNWCKAMLLVPAAMVATSIPTLF
ncbi:chromate efflux transporter [Rheinheimera texasensis]|uniref:chromate efflux transporter n=1 Tax=Rheinheimera texasensis TaxID=306205 RepID=UPI00056C878A|nr:chromate efflux transporter [Rheinheimera texasensis]